ncbi:MAG: hypothetical protein GXP38_10030 [Chloroflexi bacterium]|nr:hypothetical protein [Chloroflexota bacterium]
MNGFDYFLLILLAGGTLALAYYWLRGRGRGPVLPRKRGPSDVVDKKALTKTPSESFKQPFGTEHILDPGENIEDRTVEPISTDEPAGKDNSFRTSLSNSRGVPHLEAQDELIDEDTSSPPETSPEPGLDNITLRDLSKLESPKEGEQVVGPTGEENGGENVHVAVEDAELCEISSDSAEQFPAQEDIPGGGQEAGGQEDDKKDTAGIVKRADAGDSARVRSANERLSGDEQPHVRAEDSPTEDGIDQIAGTASGGHAGNLSLTRDRDRNAGGDSGSEVARPDEVVSCDGTPHGKPQDAAVTREEYDKPDIQSLENSTVCQDDLQQTIEPDSRGSAPASAGDGESEQSIGGSLTSEVLAEPESVETVSSTGDQCSIDEASPALEKDNTSISPEREGTGADHDGVAAPAEDIENENIERWEAKVTPAAVLDVERKRSKKRPPKYRGLSRTRPEPRESNRSNNRRHHHEEAEKRNRSFPIEVRLIFERGGFCKVSLIAKRSLDLPEDLVVATPGGTLGLRAMQDEWYQDITPPDISRAIQEGIEWHYEGNDGEYRWLLSGRELYVLAARSDLRGYVSQPCLELGREHVVLCTEHLRDQVEEAIRIAGGEPAEMMDASLGAPAGWVVFRGIVPQRAVSPTSGADILNALRPIPKIDISFEGGIRLEYNTWLEGFPPAIRVYGSSEHTLDIFIDGQCAACGEDGAYRVSDWDSPGTHTVWCEGVSKTYSIVPFAASWEAWDAYSFPIACGSDRRLSICGPLVRETVTDAQDWAPSLLVPPSNPLILGASPGECCIATRVSGVVGSSCVASPSFSPVWALPRQPLRCDKKTARIIFLGNATPPKARGCKRKTGKHKNDDCIDAWCRMILDASRKGLWLVPYNEKVRNLWFCYKRLARSIWRERR